MRYSKFMEDRKQIPGARLSAATLTLVLMIATISSLNAQRQMTLGALQNVPQLNLINPANTPNSTWHIGIPLVSGINPTYQSNLTPDQFGFGKPGAPDYFRALEFADTLNQVGGELYAELLSIGVNVGQHYFSLSVAERLIGSTEYPDQLLQWLGAEQEGVDIPLGQIFDLSDWNFSASYYRELSLGVARRLLDGKFTIAGRAKVLFGQASVRSDNYNFRLWHRPEENYNYEVTGRMDVLASGFDRFQNGGSIFQFFNSSNVGFAIDLGAQLKLGKMTLFGSVNDLGQISWKKNNTMTSIKDIAVDGDDIFQTVKDELINGGQDRSPDPFSTELVTKVYAGGQFEIGKRHAVSVLVNPRIYQGKSELNSSMAFRLHTSKFLDLVASYNIVENRYNDFGFGATVNLKPVQLYFATDRASAVFNRNAQQDFQFVAGINLLFGQPVEDKMPVAKLDKNPVQEELFGAPPILENEVADLGNRDLTEKGASSVQEDKYFTFYGTVFDDESDEPLEAIYVDVYVIGPDNQRELLHTSRYPGHTFNVPLFQSNLQHEISVGGYGYARQTLSFTADVDRLEHKFRMSDGYWSVDEPEHDMMETAQATLVHAATEAPPIEEVIQVKGSTIQEPIEIEPESIIENIATTDIEGNFEIIQRTSLRSRPHYQARVMKRLAVGTNLILLEKTDKDWWKMKLGDQIGYVKQRLLVNVPIND